MLMLQASGNTSRYGLPRVCPRSQTKLRVSGDRQGNWPASIPEYKEVYDKASNLLGSIAWNVFLELCEYAKLNPRPHFKEFTGILVLCDCCVLTAMAEDVLKDFKECVTERSAVAVIHYYTPAETQTANNSTALVDVCDEHTGTVFIYIIFADLS